MRVIGLTGASGSGKGLFSSVLAEMGVPSLDTDAVYHDITDRPGPCLSELVSAFGEDIVGENGGLSRQCLAAIVFRPDSHRAERLSSLNAITHKYVIRECEEWLKEKEKDGAAFAVIDAPLLFEAGMEAMVDLTVAVIAPKEERIRRIAARDGIGREAAERRTAAQKEDSFYRERADYILVNDGDASDFREKITELCRNIQII